MYKNSLKFIKYFRSLVGRSFEWLYTARVGFGLA